MRLTVDEYAQHFQISKEMLLSKLRAKKLNYIIDNGVTYIIVSRKALNTTTRNSIEEQKREQTKAPTKQLPAKQKRTVAMILRLYQQENRQLKEKIAQLEAKIDKLIDDKEQMLRDEIRRIEKVSSDKDAQLKMILELINSKLSLEQKESDAKIQDVEIQDVTLEDANLINKQTHNQIVELKSYLKTLHLDSYQRKVIKNRFSALYGEDIRIIKRDGKFYLDFSRYDYSDLLGC